MKNIDPKETNMACYNGVEPRTQANMDRTLKHEGLHFSKFVNFVNAYNSMVGVDVYVYVYASEEVQFTDELKILENNQLHHLTGFSSETLYSVRCNNGVLEEYDTGIPMQGH